jgi:hypothetical protein
MKRWVVLGAGMLFCASFLIRELACSPSPTDEPVVRDRQPDAEQARPLEHAPAQARDEPSAMPAPDTADVAPRPAAPPMPATGHFAAMKRAFDSESRDSQWAPAQEARLPQLMTDAGFASDAFDRDLSCRRTLCRLRLRVTEQSEDDMLALMKLASAVQTRGGLSLAYGDAEVVGDKVQVVVLIPSEATSLE